MLPIGSAEDCAEILRAYARAGAQRVFLWPLADEREQLEVFRERVVPLLGELDEQAAAAGDSLRLSRRIRVRRFTRPPRPSLGARVGRARNSRRLIVRRSRRQRGFQAAVSRPHRGRARPGCQPLAVAREVGPGDSPLSSCSAFLWLTLLVLTSSRSSPSSSRAGTPGASSTSTSECSAGPGVCVYSYARSVPTATRRSRSTTCPTTPRGWTSPIQSACREASCS